MDNDSGDDETDEPRSLVMNFRLVDKMRIRLQADQRLC